MTRGGSPACVSWDSLGAKPLSAMLDAEAASPLNPLLPSLVVAFNMDETSYTSCVLVSLPMQITQASPDCEYKATPHFCLFEGRKK